MNQTSPNNKKVLITALVSVVVIALLGVTLYVGFSGRTAGRAIFVGDAANAVAGDAGFSGELSTLTQLNEFHLITGARLPVGKQSVAYSVEVLYDSNVITFDPAFGVDGVRTPKDVAWGNDFRRVTAENGRVLFEFATLNIEEALQGDIEDIATFHFTVNSGAPLTEGNIRAGAVRFGEINILDLDAADPNTNIIINIKQPSAEIDTDDDDDGVPDDADNCPLNANADQADAGGDGVGDACDADNDGIADADDNCPAVSNADQANANGDAQGDACDDGPAVCEANDADCGQFCRDNKGAYCDFVNECQAGGHCPAVNDAFNTLDQNAKVALCAANGIEAGVCEKLSVDLNDDGVVGNDELFLIKLSLFAKDSEPQPNCGAQGQPFCLFQAQGYYICENLEYIQIINGDEQPAGGQLCGGIEHIIGGAG